jgi:hypothetical protein
MTACANIRARDVLPTLRTRGVQALCQGWPSWRLAPQGATAALPEIRSKTAHPGRDRNEPLIVSAWWDCAAVFQSQREPSRLGTQQISLFGPLQVRLSIGENSLM